MTSEEYARIENGKVVGFAMEFMLGRAKNPDGSIGYMAQRYSPEWHDWQAYFEANGMKSKASMMRQHQQFMVPCPDPRKFDPAYRPKIVDKAPMAAELTREDRERLAGRLQGMFKPAPRFKENAPKVESPLARRELSDAEKASAERLTAAVQKQRQEAAE